MLLAQAAGRILKQQTTDGEVGVFIGKDTRVSGYMLEAALQAGFLSAGVDVMLGGPLPTPAVAYLTRAQRLSAGVVISASHNPFYDNGIKFFSDKGTKLPDEMELQIEREMDRGFSCVDSARLGKARRLDDAAGRYVEFCKSTFPSDLDLKGFKILWTVPTVRPTTLRRMFTMNSALLSYAAVIRLTDSISMRVSAQLIQKLCRIAFKRLAATSVSHSTEMLTV